MRGLSLGIVGMPKMPHSVGLLLPAAEHAIDHSRGKQLPASLLKLGLQVFILGEFLADLRGCDPVRAVRVVLFDVALGALPTGVASSFDAAVGVGLAFGSSNSGSAGLVCSGFSTCPVVGGAISFTALSRFSRSKKIGGRIERTSSM